MKINRHFIPLAWWAAGLGVVSLISGCAVADQPGSSGAVKSDKQRAAPEVAGNEMDELASGNSAFAFDLYQALRGGGGNLFYSPYSISLALAMTYAGASGETEAQMAGVLHYTLSQERLHPTFNALDTTLTGYGESDDGFQLKIANAIWGQEEYAFLDTYLDLLAEHYGAGLRTMDFAGDPEAARETINDWVSEQTEEKIKNLIPSGMLNALVRLILTNAIYFNGKWVLPFEESDTHDDTFTLLDGTEITVPMMWQTESFAYAEGDGYQAISLPYQGAPMSMVFVLPESGRFEVIEDSFTAGFFADVTGALSLRSVALSAPKFTFESEFNLASTLADMGMPAAFGDGADFSGMTGEPDLFISDVVHKAFVAVDEAGTEAAAATAVVMAEMAVMPAEDTVEMRLDRPFLFAIRDDNTGTILFVGRVLKP